jgi:hypothetical protein
MNKRGDTNIIMDNLIYLVIFIAFFLMMFWFVGSYSNGSAFYEDFYAKEISRIINSASPGMEFKIDVTPIAVAAFKNKKPLKDIVSIDNVNNKVIISSRSNTGTSFSFFKDVDIVDYYIESPSGGAETTRFIFKVKGGRRNEG